MEVKAHHSEVQFITVYYKEIDFTIKNTDYIFLNDDEAVSLICKIGLTIEKIVVLRNVWERD